MMRRENDAGPAGLFDPEKARFPRDRALQLLPPLNFYVERYGFGVRVVVVDRAHENTDTPGTSAISYHIHWAESVDTNTADGIAAGFARSILLAPAIPAAGRKGAPSSAIFSDPQYVEGYFYCTPVAADGKRGAATGPVRITSGSGGTIPADVQHFRCSESGEQDGQGTLSKISYAFEVPDIIENVDKFQFYFLHYPVLNQLSQSIAISRTSGAGGSQTGDIRMPVARRVGVGTIAIVGDTVFGIGTNFAALAAADGGDELEVYGVRAMIASVSSPTLMLLDAAWTGPSVSGEASWRIMGSVGIYCVSVGYDGSRRDDVENAPFARVVLDGELSAPNSPTLAVFTIPHAIRVEVTPSSGTEIAEIRVWRGTGSGEAFADTAVVHTFKADQINGSTPLQWDDTDFTINQKEDGQVFTYYATAVNVRDQESEESASAEASCLLTAAQDVDPSTVGRIGIKQMLYNGFIAGDDLQDVRSDDGLQDRPFDVNAGVDEPGQPYDGIAQTVGVGKYRGYTRWASTKTAGAPTLPYHRNGNEVVLPAPTAGNEVYLFQELDAWETNETYRFVKIKKGGTYILSAYMKRGATVPSGTVSIVIEQYNEGTQLDYALRRYRDGSGVLQTVQTPLNIAGSTLLTTWQRFYAVFIIDDTLTPTRQVRFTFTHSNSTAGGDVIVCQAMLSEGEDLGIWIGDMGDTDIAWPTPGDPSGPWGDGAGTDRGIILVP